jgi:hypothetical protein
MDNWDVRRRRFSVALLVVAATAALGAMLLRRVAGIQVAELPAEGSERWATSTNYERLAHSEWFVGGTAAMMDGPTPHLLAFNAVLSGPNAASSFRRMVVEGSAAGKLYGICGLRSTDAQTFRELRPRLLESLEVLRFADGCEPASIVLHELGSPRAPNLSSFCDWLGASTPPPIW